MSLTAAVLLTGCNDESQSASKRPQIGFITNTVADFWTIAVRGTEKAAAEFDVDVKVSQPPPTSAVLVEQKTFLEDMVARGFDGIAITSYDPANQTPLFNEIAKKTHLITHDSDAPESDRLCFIGVDNYEAGRMVGELIKDALPDGGEIMLFIGVLDQDNARRRRQGVIDELFGRSRDPDRRDDVGEVLVSADEKYTILGCKTDGMERAACKNNAEDTLTKHPDLACMVGLFEYNPPLLLEAAQRMNRLDKVKIIGFDENKDTLQGIRDGTVQGTVVQDPYNYGYLSVKILAALARGDNSLIPKNKIEAVPARKITKANVDSFEQELNARLGK